MVDWEAIKTEYCTTGISQEALALEHDVSYSALKRRAQQEKWKDLKQETSRKAAEKTAETITDAKVKKIEKIVDILLSQSMAASRQLTKRAKQIREIEELEDGRQRVTVRTEYEAGNVVDRAGLKILTQAVKDLDEVLRKQRQDAQGGDAENVITVRFENETGKDYSI